MIALPLERSSFIIPASTATQTESTSENDVKTTNLLNPVSPVNLALLIHRFYITLV